MFVEEKPRTVLDAMIDHILDASAKAAAEEVRQRESSREIENSQKAMTERLRDEWFY